MIRTPRGLGAVEGSHHLDMVLHRAAVQLYCPMQIVLSICRHRPAAGRPIGITMDIAIGIIIVCHCMVLLSYENCTPDATGPQLGGPSRPCVYTPRLRRNAECGGKGTLCACEYAPPL